LCFGDWPRNCPLGFVKSIDTLSVNGNPHPVPPLQQHQFQTDCGKTERGNRKYISDVKKRRELARRVNEMKRGGNGYRKMKAG
jgi:hypothetical protein